MPPSQIFAFLLRSPPLSWFHPRLSPTFGPLSLADLGVGDSLTAEAERVRGQLFAKFQCRAARRIELFECDKPALDQ